MAKILDFNEAKKRQEAEELATKNRLWGDMYVEAIMSGFSMEQAMDIADAAWPQGNLIITFQEEY